MQFLHTMHGLKLYVAVVQPNALFLSKTFWRSELRYSMKHSHDFKLDRFDTSMNYETSGNWSGWYNLLCNVYPYINSEITFSETTWLFLKISECLKFDKPWEHCHMEYRFPFNNTLHFVSVGYLKASYFLLYHQENTLKPLRRHFKH